MQARRAELAGALAPCDRNEAARCVSQMMLAFPQAKDGQESARALIAAYVAQVEEFPLWAVASGCKAMAGRASAWVPSAGELREAVRALIESHAEELRKITRILTAEVAAEPTPADREAMRERFAGLRVDLGSKTVERPSEVTQAEAQVWLDREQAKPKEAIAISDALAGVLARQAKERGQ